jgi:hypothetical protein
MSVITASSFNAKVLTTSELRKLDNGSGQVYLNYNGGRLRVQTPQMSIPYDAGDYNGNRKYKVNLSFKGANQNPKLAKFQDMVQAVDNYVIDTAVTNAGKWFKMPGASRELVAAFFTPSLKVSKDKEGNVLSYPPNMKVKLPKKNGSFETTFYDEKKRPYEGVGVEDLRVKGARAVFLLRCTGLWFAGSKFGASWKATQCKMDHLPERMRGCAILDDDSAPSAGGGGGRRAVAAAEEDEEDVVAAVMPAARRVAPAAAARPAPAPVAAEEEDEEEEDDVVEAPPPPVRPAATAAKKVVKKTTK